MLSLQKRAEGNEKKVKSRAELYNALLLRQTTGIQPARCPVRACDCSVSHKSSASQGQEAAD